MKSEIIPLLLVEVEVVPMGHHHHHQLGVVVDPQVVVGVYLPLVEGKYAQMEDLLMNETQSLPPHAWAENVVVQ